MGSYTVVRRFTDGHAFFRESESKELFIAHGSCQDPDEILQFQKTGVVSVDFSRPIELAATPGGALYPLLSLRTAKGGIGLTPVLPEEAGWLCEEFGMAFHMAGAVLRIDPDAGPVTPPDDKLIAFMSEQQLSPPDKSPSPLPDKESETLRAFVDECYRSDGTQAMLSLTREFGIGVAYIDRVLLESYLERPMTEEEWDTVKLHLEDYDEFACDTSSVQDSFVAYVFARAKIEYAGTNSDAEEGEEEAWAEDSWAEEDEDDLSGLIGPGDGEEEIDEEDEDEEDD